MNPNVCFNVWIVNNVSSCILPRISDQSFFFQYDPDWMWPVNMPGKMKGWPVNFPVSPDIVRWPAVISSFVLSINLYSVRFYCYFIFYSCTCFLTENLWKFLLGSQVRGVGAGGIVSSAFCLLYKLFTLKLTRKQLNGLITHVDSPYIRALGFMFIRYEE